jgi:hypothetical protein
MVAIYDEPSEQFEVASEFEHTTASMRHLLARFQPISLSEMENVTLLNRMDTKYVMGTSQLSTALQHVVEDYLVLDIDTKRLNHYQTLYFDTQDFALYRQHHNGLRSRYKVRVREYVDSDLAFLEVKRKTNRERTIKLRLQTPDVVTEIDRQADEFVDAHTPFDGQALEPKLWNDFLRITLVSKHRAERLTLDLNLEFGWGDTCVALPGIAIAEVKQERFSQHSNFMQQMRRLGIRTTRFSKYCAGVYLLYDHVKTNNFKSRMLLLDKVMRKELGYEYVR